MKRSLGCWATSAEQASVRRPWAAGSLRALFQPRRKEISRYRQCQLVQIAVTNSKALRSAPNAALSSATTPQILIQLLATLRILKMRQRFLQPTMNLPRSGSASRKQSASANPSFCATAYRVTRIYRDSLAQPAAPLHTNSKQHHTVKLVFR